MDKIDDMSPQKCVNNVIAGSYEDEKKRKLAKSVLCGKVDIPQDSYED
jgi:hypothetical protein